MGEISIEVIVLITIVASRALVLFAWASHSIWHGQLSEDEGMISGSGQQQQKTVYRNGVKIRNHDDVAAINGFK